MCWIKGPRFLNLLKAMRKCLGAFLSIVYRKLRRTSTNKKLRFTTSFKLRDSFLKELKSSLMKIEFSLKKGR